MFPGRRENITMIVMTISAWWRHRLMCVQILCVVYRTTWTARLDLNANLTMGIRWCWRSFGREFNAICRYDSLKPIQKSDGMPCNISWRSGDGRRKAEAEDVLDLRVYLGSVKAPLTTFVAANLERVPDTPVADTDICALKVNVLSWMNQLDDLMGRMAAFIELKNQVVELTDNIKANKSVLRELRSEFVDVKSEIFSMASQLQSITWEMTSAWSTNSSGSMVGVSATTSDFRVLSRPAGWFSWVEKNGFNRRRSDKIQRRKF